MEKKTHYEELEFEVISFDENDVITTSPGGGSVNPDETPIIGLGSLPSLF